MYVKYFIFIFKKRIDSDYYAVEAFENKNQVGINPNIIKLK